MVPANQADSFSRGMHTTEFATVSQATGQASIQKFQGHLGKGLTLDRSIGFTKQTTDHLGAGNTS